MNLTTEQHEMLRAIARGAEPKLDPKAFAALYRLGLVAINAPGQRLISMTQLGKDLICREARAISDYR